MQLYTEPHQLDWGPSSRADMEQQGRTGSDDGEGLGSESWGQEG